jgi:hypothetical protein
MLLGLKLIDLRMGIGNFLDGEPGIGMRLPLWLRGGRVEVKKDLKRLDVGRLWTVDMYINAVAGYVLLYT